MTFYIHKAVFPIAGLGSRFLPATKASAKEMLPVVDKPLIQYAVEEAYEAGIRHMIFVTGRTKRSVEDHFDTAYELENELEQAGKTELLKIARSISPTDMVCSYVRQPRALGLGHAVLCAEPLVGHEPFAVLLADDLMVGKPSITAQMVKQYEELQSSILAVQDVPLEHTNRYGIVSGASVNNVLTSLSGIVEKPAPVDAPGTLAVAGRYILSPAIFQELKITPKGAGGEIQLTDAIAQLLSKEKVFAYRYQGTRYDCGSKLGFLQATVDLGEHHPQVGAEFTAWLASRC
jgi:UTP--glucose-1-phosphate uridylyltransferase